MGAPALFLFLPLESCLRIAWEVCSHCPPWNVAGMGLCSELCWQAVDWTSCSFASAHAVPGLPRCDDESRVFWFHFTYSSFFVFLQGDWVNTTFFTFKTLHSSKDWSIASMKRGTSISILSNLLQRLHVLFAQYFGAWWEQTLQTALLSFQVFGANWFSTMLAMQREEETKKKRYLTFSAMQLQQNQFAKETGKITSSTSTWIDRCWLGHGVARKDFENQCLPKRQDDRQDPGNRDRWIDTEPHQFYIDQTAYIYAAIVPDETPCGEVPCFQPKQQGLSLMFQQKFKRCGWTNFSSLTSLSLGKGVTKLSNFWWLENALMQFGATSSSRWVIWMCGLLAANHLELPRSKKSALRTLIQFRWLQPIHACMRVMRLPLLGSRTVGGCRWRFLCVSIWSWRFQRPCFLQSAGIWSSEGTAVFATKIDAGWSWSIVVTMLRTLRKSCCFCLSPKNVPSPWRTAWLCNLFCFNFFQSYKLWNRHYSHPVSLIMFSMFHS